jgi:four helix bundle protein
MGLNSFEDLNVWKNGVDIAEFVLSLVERFHQQYLFGLANQMQKSSISIPSNIAEGNSRQHTKEYIQFCYISLGSSAELLTQTIIARRKKYITEHEYLKISEMINSERRMILGLIRSLQQRQKRVK